MPYHDLVAGGRGPTLGDAYIAVHADPRSFEPELAEAVKKIVEKMGPELKESGRKAGKKGGEGVKEGFEGEEKKVRSVFTRIGDFLRNEGNRWHRTISGQFEKMAKGNFILTRLFGQFGKALIDVGAKVLKLGGIFFNFGRGIAESFVAAIQIAIEAGKNLIGVGGDISRAVTSLGSGMARVGSAVAAAGAEIASFLPAAIAVVAVISALAAAFGVLLIVLATVAAPFAQLLNFALLIPAALSTFLAILAPLIISLHNLGDVMKLVGEKDSKKFNEGLKKLSPTMQTLTTSLRGLMPIFQDISNSVQSAFFTPIIKRLAPTLKNLAPTLKTGLTQVAGALGGLIAQVLTFLGSPEMQGFLMTLFPMVSNMIKTMGPTLIQILSALTAASAAALPAIQDLLNTFGGFLNKFATWLQGAINDGRFQQWLDDAKTALSAIWGLVKALIGLFGTLFANLKSGGNDFLNTLTNAINKFTNWLKSPQGQKAMENMVALANLVADAFDLALTYVAHILEIMNTIVGIWKWLRGHGLAPSIGGTLGALAKSVSPHSYSGGGVVPYDQMAQVHRGEPILDPANSTAKNRSILADAGMLDTLSQGTTVVNVYLGTERLDEKIDFRVARSNQRTSRSLLAGTR